MKVSSIPFEETNNFSSIFLDYINQKDSLKPFYNHFPSIDNFRKTIEEKKRFEHREILCEVLESQYNDLQNTKEVEKNIELLKQENTFTITSGHQLNIATGPLFFVYKIISAINSCKELKNKYQQYNFVPVYWMASEDHDYEEIKSFSLFGKTHSWETEQTGAVGRFSLDSIQSMLDELNEPIPTLEHYRSSENLAEATLKIVHELFGNEGLVILDADNSALKKLFFPYAKKEIEENTSFNAVNSSNTELEKNGYKSQAFPREINLFHLEENSRNRIIKDGSSFSTTEGKKLDIDQLKKHPEQISPNVILRPLYQEIILPNLAYIGGPGELAYWFQLKKTFEAFDVDFPILMPRSHSLVIQPNLNKKLSKLNITPTELFVTPKELTATYLSKLENTSFDLNEETQQIDTIFEALKVKVAVHNKGLVQAVDIEKNKVFKQLNNLEKRTSKQIEQSHEQGIKSLENVHNKLFPQGSLQEREENIFSFYINEPTFISDLIKVLKPFDFRYKIITYE